MRFYRARGWVEEGEGGSREKHLPGGHQRESITRGFETVQAAMPARAPVLHRLHDQAWNASKVPDVVRRHRIAEFQSSRTD
jgi:hypothetical protein